MSASTSSSAPSEETSSEASSLVSEEPVSEEPVSEEPVSEEPVTGEQQARKPRGSVTPGLVASLVKMVNASKKPNIKAIALTLGVSFSTIHRILRKIRSGELVRDNKVVLPANVKGRRRRYNSRTVEIVKDVLTSDATMTLEMARQELEARGITMSTATIWRIATKRLKLRHKKISTRPAAVFNQEMEDKRFDYGQQVNQINYQVLWFLDESGFNLHIAPLRCWAPEE